VIIDTSESRILSMSRVSDRGSLWICDTMKGEAATIRFSSASRVQLYEGSDDLFAAARSHEDGRLAISAHAISDPEPWLASIRLIQGSWQFEGDRGVWRSLPRAYLAWAPVAGGVPEPYLVLLDGDTLDPRSQRLSWYAEAPYDHSYQELLSVQGTHSSDPLLFSVQRSSSLVLYDPARDVVVKDIELAGRRGSPSVWFRRTAPEVWATDYDTLLRIDTRDWSVQDQVRLGADGNRREWIGRLHFNHDESLCVVPRPQREDVLLVDSESFSVQRIVHTGRDPFEAVVLRDGRVFARSVGTGELLMGDG
jgi:hypothetical protein